MIDMATKAGAYAPLSHSTENRVEKLHIAQ